MVEEVIRIDAPCVDVHAIKGHAYVVIRSEALDLGTDVVVFDIRFHAQQRAVKPKAVARASVFHAAKQVADIDIIAHRYGQICEIRTHRRRRIRPHLHLLVVGQYEVVGVDPRVGGELDVEFCAGADHISRVVCVEEAVAPAVSVDAESRELAPGGNRVERKVYGRGTGRQHCQCDNDYQ